MCIVRLWVFWLILSTLHGFHRFFFLLALCISYFLLDKQGRALIPYKDYNRAEKTKKID